MLSRFKYKIAISTILAFTLWCSVNQGHAGLWKKIKKVAKSTIVPSLPDPTPPIPSLPKPPKLPVPIPIPDPLKTAINYVDEVKKDAEKAVKDELAKAGGVHALEKNLAPLNKIVGGVKNQYEKALNKLPLPPEVRFALNPAAITDWAQIEAYVRVTREVGKYAKKRSQDGQKRYIEFLREWLSNHKFEVEEATELNAKAAGVPRIPSSVDMSKLDEEAKSRKLSHPQYPWHSPPNGAGPHNFEVPNTFLGSKTNAKAIFVQHDKDYQSPKVSQKEADDKMESSLKALFHKAHPGLEFLK